MSLEDGVQVDLCGVEMCTGVATADGVEWLVPGEIDGWDSPVVRTFVSDPTARHGTFAAAGLYGGRELILPGEAFADTKAEAWAGYYRATSAMPGVLGTALLVVHEDPVKWLRVVANGKPAVSSPVNGCFSFTLPLLAPDPFKRALTPHVVTIAAGDTVDVPNAGTFTATVSLEAKTSGKVALRQDVSGQILRTAVSVAAGTTFNAADRTVRTSAGLLIYPLTTPSEWLSIPRDSLTPMTNVGDVDVDVTVYDTYA